MKVSRFQSSSFNCQPAPLHHGHNLTCLAALPPPPEAKTTEADHNHREGAAAASSATTATTATTGSLTFISGADEKFLRVFGGGGQAQKVQARPRF